MIGYNLQMSATGGATVVVAQTVTTMKVKLLGPAIFKVKVQGS